MLTSSSQSLEEEVYYRLRKMHIPKQLDDIQLAVGGVRCGLLGLENRRLWLETNAAGAVRTHT